MKYRRLYIEGGTYFFTLVTYNRMPIFLTEEAIQLLNNAIEYTSARMPFEVLAYVILPDHMHFIWALPETSSDYSTRWRLIKSYFTRNNPQKENATISSSRAEKKEKYIWQRRFWEHWVRDEHDLRRHVEYIHYNPIKHGYVQSLLDWKYSSFSKCVTEGLYPSNWGESIEVWPGEMYME